MKTLWSVEFYKLRKSLHLKLACLGAVLHALAGVYVYTQVYEMTGFSSLMDSFVEWQMPYLCCGIFAAFYISDDLENGGIREEIMSGFGRLEIYLVKTCMFLIGSVVVLFCHQLIPTVVSSAINGGLAPEQSASAGRLIVPVLRLEGICLISFLACAGICMPVSSMFPKAAGSVVAEVVYHIVILQSFLYATRVGIMRRLYLMSPYGGFSMIFGNILDSCGESWAMLPVETIGQLGQIDGTGGLLLREGIAFLLFVTAGYPVFRRT